MPTLPAEAAESFSLSVEIAKFIVPRLKAFKEQCVAYPVNVINPRDNASTLSSSEWVDILSDMIFAFELCISDNEENLVDIPKDLDFGYSVENSSVVMKDPRGIDLAPLRNARARQKRGLELFSVYFRSLWL